MREDNINNLYVYVLCTVVCTFYFADLGIVSFKASSIQRKLAELRGDNAEGARNRVPHAALPARSSNPCQSTHLSSYRFISLVPVGIVKTIF